jgi:hypothetical protein
MPPLPSVYHKPSELGRSHTLYRLESKEANGPMELLALTAPGQLVLESHLHGVRERIHAVPPLVEDAHICPE